MFIFGSTYNNMDSSLAMPNEVITNHSDLEFFFFNCAGHTLFMLYPLTRLTFVDTSTVLCWEYTAYICYISTQVVYTLYHVVYAVQCTRSRLYINLFLRQLYKSQKVYYEIKSTCRDGNQMGKYSSNTCIFQTHNLPVQCHNLRYNGIRLQTVPYIETVIVV